MSSLEGEQRIGARHPGRRLEIVATMLLVAILFTALVGCGYVLFHLRQPPAAWSPNQAAGPPNTAGTGDIPTAWASKTEDGQDEWLVLDYAVPVVPASITVHETFNPGALYRVSVFKKDGTEVTAWTGKDPTPPGAGRGASTVPIKVDFEVNRVKLYLKSRTAKGWNEIDAVELKDSTGGAQWAVSVTASSTYAER